MAEEQEKEVEKEEEKKAQTRLECELIFYRPAQQTAHREKSKLYTS